MGLNNNARGKPSGIKLIGIGQSMRGDDAAGLLAVSLWQENFQGSGNRSKIEVELAELPGIGLLDMISGVRIAILVDAMRSGAQAGTVRVFTEEQLDAFTSGSSSAHGLGVAETLALGRKVLQSQMPGRLILVGIEASDISVGEGLSEAVQAALPKAAHLIEQMLAEAIGEA